MTEEKDRYRAPACLAPPSSHPFPQETPDKKPTQRTSSQNPYTGGKVRQEGVGSRTVADGTLPPTAGPRVCRLARDRRHQPAPLPARSSPLRPSTGAGLTPGPEPRVDTARCPPRTNKGTAPGTDWPWAGHREGGTVARARAAGATAALALRATRQPDEGVPACRQRAALPEGSVMGRVGPVCRRFVRYYRNRVFRAFFHALPENRLVRDSQTRLAVPAILSSNPSAGAGCLTHCFAAQDSYSGGFGAQISDGAYIPTWSSHHPRSFLYVPVLSPCWYHQHPPWPLGVGRSPGRGCEVPRRRAARWPLAARGIASLAGRRPARRSVSVSVCQGERVSLTRFPLCSILAPSGAQFGDWDSSLGLAECRLRDGEADDVGGPGKGNVVQAQALALLRPDRLSSRVPGAADVFQQPREQALECMVVIECLHLRALRSVFRP